MLYFSAFCQFWYFVNVKCILRRNISLRDQYSIQGIPTGFEYMGANNNYFSQKLPTIGLNACFLNVLACLFIVSGRCLV